MSTPTAQTEAVLDDARAGDHGIVGELLDRHAAWLLALYWPALAAATHWPDLQLQRIEPWPIAAPRRFAAFALLTMLLGAALPVGRCGRHRLNAAAAVGIALAYTAIDQATQPLVGRPADLAPAAASTLGILVAGLFVRWRGGYRPAEALWALRLLALALLGLFVYRSLTRGSPVPHWMHQLPRFSAFVSMDKMAHFYGGAGLTALLLFTAPLGRRRPWLALLVVLPLMLAIQPIIERLQPRFGRGHETADIIAHTVGVAVAVAAWGAIRLAVHLARKARR